MSAGVNRGFHNANAVLLSDCLPELFASQRSGKIRYIAHLVSGWTRPGSDHYLCAIRGSLFVVLFLSLVGFSNAIFAKTLERSCKGAWIVKYEVEGKTQTKIGPFNITEKGSSSGAVPSPVKARRRACQAAAKRAAASTTEQRALNVVCRTLGHGSGRMTFLGGIGRSKGETQTYKTLDRSKSFECRNGRVYKAPVCGNSKKEGLEECDNGHNNSDTIPNACRTNCTRADCGDGVVDNGEQCDDGTRNHNKIPGACRSSCKRAYCGDGVLDVSEGEMCDDGNTNPYDGCHQCQHCVVPKNDLTITQDTRLCMGDHRAPDTQGNGAIRITGSNVTLDCRGSRLKGSNRKGIGILVSGSNVVLRGCDVSGFSTGIDVQGSGAVIFGNRVCGNGIDFKVGGSGVFAAKNSCNKAGSAWREGDKPGCTSTCQ